MSDVTKPPSWDPFRFWQTLVFFEVIPWAKGLSCLQRWVAGDPLRGSQGGAADLPSPPSLASYICDFSSQSSAQSAPQLWGSLDDVVMGGVSQSYLQFLPDQAIFEGSVSTANSGGFVSVRTRNFDPPLDLSAYQGIQLRLQGDGQRYKFFLRNDSGWDSLAYYQGFDTQAGEWMTVRIPFADLVPIFRAKTVNGATPFNPAQVSSLQIMLSKFEADGLLNPHFHSGSFRLAIASIGVY
ncbi:MAG: CIA30 family protein [Cyanobacteriota bacterium]|nr:CIA30 family protein [Cyanobacteriota bacterium]